MSNLLCWDCPRLASVVHVMRWLHDEDRQGQEDWATAIADSARQLIVPESFWTAAISAATDDLPDASLVADWLCPTGASPAPESTGVQAVHAALRTAVGIWDARFPEFQQEMQLRLGPLNQQWLAYGPGYVRCLEKRLGPCDLTTRSLRVVGLLPVRHGWGQADLDIPCLQMELMLVNANDRLPELARLAWMLTWLWIGRCQSDRNDPQRAAVPLTLALCDGLDWLHQDAQTTELAWNMWLRTEVPDDLGR